MNLRLWMITAVLTQGFVVACNETSTTPVSSSPGDSLFGNEPDAAVLVDAATADTGPSAPQDTTQAPDSAESVADTASADPDGMTAEDTSTGTEPTPAEDVASVTEELEFDTELCGSFDGTIQALFDKACVGCHNAQAPLGGIDLSAGTSYETLTTQTSQSGVAYVVPGDVSLSYLASKLTDTPLDGVKMPPPPGSLSDDEVEQVMAWIGNGAPNDTYGPCVPEPPQGTAISFEIISQETKPGNLVIALFKQFPPMGPPDHVVEIPNAVFPVKASIDNVLPGTYTAYVVLDVAPFSAGSPGPEDISTNASVKVPAPSTVVLSLGSFEDTCGECALDATCGGDATNETLCVAPPGSCGDTPVSGLCFSDDIVIRCSNANDPNGVLVSQDCSLTGQMCGALTDGPNAFGCIEKPDPEPVWDPVSFPQVHPIFQKKCSGVFCHGLGFASDNVDSAYDTVLTKGLTKKILGAVQAGSMPKGFLGATICTGDPSVDTNPKCLTQEELDLLILWVATETGEAPYQEPPTPEVPVSFAEVHPILNDKCSGGVCHGGGFANPDIDKAYDAIVEKNLCKNIWFQIQYGKMPIGKGCSGDPIEDSMKDGCLDETEYNLVKDWANGEIPCAE